MSAPVTEAPETILTPELIAQLKAMGLDIPGADRLEGMPVTEARPAPAAPAPAAADKLRAFMDQRSSSPKGLLGAIDLTQVETRDFRLLPLDTRIEAQIVGREMTTSQAGNDQMIVSLKTTYPLEYAGVDLRDFILLDPHDPKRSWKFKSLCEACTMEIDGQEVPLLHNGRYIGDENGDAFLGNIVAFEAEHNEYNAKTYNKVKGGYTAGTETPGL